MSQILKARFGLEAVIYHETLSEEMFEFLPNHQCIEENAYYTLCYLVLPQESACSPFASSVSADSQDQQVESNILHTAFRQVIDPSTLAISEKQRFRFARALKKLNLKPYYHLSELEPLIVHPIQDEDLACLCSCPDGDCPGACTDIHSWDRPYCLEQTLKSKSKGMYGHLPHANYMADKLFRASEGVVAEAHAACCLGHNHAFWLGRVNAE